MAAIELRQSTAGQHIPLGKFVDDTDFKTAETALTIANTDIKLFKEGASASVNKNSGGATHYGGGHYYATLDATDSNTPGKMRVSVDVAGALGVWLDCEVLTQEAYDFKYAATGAIPSMGVVARGTAQAATSTTIQLASAESFADGTLVGATVLAHGSTQGYWQSRQITAYTGATDTATVDAWSVTPSGTITYVVLGSPSASLTDLPPVHVATVANNALTAAALATDAVTEIAGGVLAETVDGVTVADLLSAAGAVNFSISGNTLTVKDAAGNTLFTRNLTLAQRDAINAAAP